MRIGVFLRNMGPASTPEIISECAKAADSQGIDDLWVLDHIAIPPDESEGSGGRYVDPLATLAFVAGTTQRVRLGVSVLIAPYRAPLPTAKWLASIQELSGGRLCAGFGVGWMAAEFSALAVDRSRRGKITDETLAAINTCFASDEVELNGQKFLFNPRPSKPPVLIGGAPENAIPRVVEFAEGWMPMGLSPEDLAPHAADLQSKLNAAGKPAPEIIPLAAVPTDDLGAAAELLNSYAEIGATGIEYPAKYDTTAEFCRCIEGLLEAKSRAGY